IKKLLAQRGGPGSETDLNEMASVVVQYIPSVWHGRHPPSTMGVRSVSEMRMATKDGHWHVAQHLEVSGDPAASLAQARELRDAMGAFTSDAKLAAHLSSIGKK
ncbi:unnamed protein product, partial [Prorocentrum cordatum]